MVNLLLSMLSWPKVTLLSVSHCKCVFLLFKKGIVRSLNNFFVSVPISSLLFEKILHSQFYQRANGLSSFHPHSGTATSCRYWKAFLEVKLAQTEFQFFLPLSSVVSTFIPNYTWPLHPHNIPPYQNKGAQFKMLAT